MSEQEEPEVSPEIKARLVRFYEFYAPDKVRTAELALKAYIGREDAMFRALESKYGPESAIPGVAEEEPQSPTAGEGQQESEPETPPPPPPPEDEDETPVKPVVTPLPLQQLAASPAKVPKLDFNLTRRRLIRFYDKYAPEKVDQVDAALKAYEGKEEAMFRALEKKYGPEPRTPGRTGKTPRRSASPKLTSPARDEGNADEGANDNEAPEEGAGDEEPDFDYRAGLAQVGIPEAHFDSLLNYYGSSPEHQSYSAAIAMLVRCIGEDDLFDVITQRDRIPFPKQLYPKDRDDIDDIAFDHVNEYRNLFRASWAYGMQIRNDETAEREKLLLDFDNRIKRMEYQKLLLSEAVRLLPTIEAESREIIVEDEKLRFQGVVSWFRQNRDELLVAQEESPKLQEVAIKLERFKDTANAAAKGIEVRRDARRQTKERQQKWDQQAAEHSPLRFRSTSSLASPPTNSNHATRVPDYATGRSHSYNPASPARSESARSVSQQPTILQPTWRHGGNSNSMSVQQQATRIPSASATSAPRSASPTVSQRTPSTATNASRSLSAMTSQSSLTKRMSEVEKRLHNDPLSSRRATKVASRGAFSTYVYASGRSLSTASSEGYL